MDRSCCCVLNILWGWVGQIIFIIKIRNIRVERVLYMATFVLLV